MIEIYIYVIDIIFKNTNALAQMEAVSFFGGVRQKRYSVQLELASKNMYKYKNKKATFGESSF
jgi:hypothetical protein